jgi:hypothetical protein
MGELDAALRDASERLTRATQDIAEADLQTVERLIKLLEAVGASVKNAGGLAAERRRRLMHDQGLARHAHARSSAPGAKQDKVS